jgi:hypothetical protein
MADDADPGQPYDLTPTAASLLRPIMGELVMELEGDITDLDAIRIGEALAHAFKAGVRVGGAEAIGGIQEELRGRGIDLDVTMQVLGDEEADED